MIWKTSATSSVAGTELRGFFAFPILSELNNSWPLIIGGLAKTIVLSSVVTVNGLCGGVLVFWLTLSRNRIVQRLTRGYISLFIGTPLIVFLFLLYYGLPGLGVTLSPFTIAVIGFFQRFSLQCALSHQCFQGP